MKTILPALAGMLLLCLSFKASAQCSVSNFSTEVKTVKPKANAYEALLDIHFTASFNNGNKYAYIHIWPTSEASTYSNLKYKVPPTAADLAKALGTIVIKNPATNGAQIHEAYIPAASVPVLKDGITIERSGNKGSVEYTVKNVKVTIPTLEAGATIYSDVWASQSQNGVVVHCSDQGVINGAMLELGISGAVFCVTPRQYQISFTNTSTSNKNENLQYQVYIDQAPFGERDANDIQIFSSNTAIGIKGGASYTTGRVNFPAPYNTAAYANASLYVDAQFGSGINQTTVTGYAIENACAATPVKFKSFTANREEKRVALKWETAMEQDNKGFYIQRSVNGEWKDIGLVFSQNENGNSSTTLSYAFNDMNPVSGPAHYRILQVDFNGKGMYSEVRTIGNSKAGTKLTLFPNPSHSGYATLVFEKSGSREVWITDLNGRIVKQYSNVSGNSLDVYISNPGYYTVAVKDKSTGSTSLQKLVIRKK